MRHADTMIAATGGGRVAAPLAGMPQRMALALHQAGHDCGVTLAGSRADPESRDKTKIFQTGKKGLGRSFRLTGSPVDQMVVRAGLAGPPQSLPCAER